ncbi:MAG: hypothetical protein V4534_07105 [Myxococcota bacterium]
MKQTKLLTLLMLLLISACPKTTRSEVENLPAPLSADPQDSDDAGDPGVPANAP